MEGSDVFLLNETFRTQVIAAKKNKNSNNYETVAVKYKHGITLKK